MEVKEIMSSPVEAISPDAMITEAADKMKEFDIGVLPVMKQDKIAGMITDRDIVVRIIAERLNPQNTPVSRVMTSDVVCCYEDTGMEEAARMMEEKKVHRLVVLGHNQTVAGILSVGDIARKMKDEHILYEILERVCEPARTY